MTALHRGAVTVPLVTLEAAFCVETPDDEAAIRSARFGTSREACLCHSSDGKEDFAPEFDRHLHLAARDEIGTGLEIEWSFSALGILFAVEHAAPDDKPRSWSERNGYAANSESREMLDTAPRLRIEATS